MNVSDVVAFIATRGGPWDVMRFAPLTGTEQVEYIGIAPRSSATSAAAWQVFKLTYSGTFVELIQSSLRAQIWDNRASLTFG